MADDLDSPEMVTALNLAALATKAEMVAETEAGADPREDRQRNARRDTLAAYWEGGTE